MENKNFIDKLSPRAAFKTGLASGLAILFMVGFFVLLGVLLNKDEKTTTYSKKTSNEVSVNKDSGQRAVNPQPTGNKQINIKPVDKENDWIRGDVDARVSVIEFSDTECPFCKRFHSTMQEVVDYYDGEVNWVYRHFPLVQLHSKAPKEAQATECAGEQGGNDAFWAYIDRLFEVSPTNNGLPESALPEIAEYVGLDVGQFQSCLDSGKYADKVSDHTAQATAAGGTGTPYSVIVSGDTKVPIPGALPIEQVKSLIDPLLNNQ
ncbi:hypothetical protein C0580_05035 [Candidatus Parcubacteria bacterium]|nr:MAG: hypothetical protein C0580_05035 [Candidatus Parcubacteria bacterium]